MANWIWMLFGVVSTEQGRSRNGLNVGHPIITNEDLVAQLFSAVRSGDEVLPKLLCDFLLYYITITTYMDRRLVCLHFCTQEQ